VNELAWLFKIATDASEPVSAVLFFFYASFPNFVEPNLTCSFDRAFVPSAWRQPAVKPAKSVFGHRVSIDIRLSFSHLEGI
jgi:hypothetical protein